MLSNVILGDYLLRGVAIAMRRLVVLPIPGGYTLRGQE